jgi:FemAB-related protein (PEP-CTERM system-associated)
VTEPGPGWDEFVEVRAEASLGHAAAWSRVLREAYGLPVYHLIERDLAGRVTGILGLARLRTWRGHSELVSLPFLDSAGILAVDPGAGQALRERSLALARQLGARLLELRQQAAAPGQLADGAGSRVDLVLPLESAEESQWKALSAKVRNQTRKAEREGLLLSDASRGELVDEFYAVFCENMRDLGSPVHSRRFFAAIAQAFGERARFVVTRLAGRPVGGLVALHFAGQVTVPWAATLRAERARCPNNQIYWEAIRWAIQRGAREFDFGRSPRGGGTHRFKLGWGARERELPWQRLAPDGTVLASGASAQTEHGLLQLLSRAWQRLPVPLASFLGARLRRYFPN